MEDVGILCIWPCGLFYGHLEYLHILRPFGLLYQEKSGDPGHFNHKLRISSQGILSELFGRITGKLWQVSMY
jgi:hypothetical protein